MTTLPDTPNPDEIPEPETDLPARDLDWPDALHVEFTPYAPEPGERYWRLVKARVGPEDNELHHIFVMEPHAPTVALEVAHTYGSGSDHFAVALDGAVDEPAANVPMWGDGNTYSVRLAGYGTTKSDVVGNLHLPKNTHVVARLWWEFVEAPALSFDEQLFTTAAEQQVIEFNPGAALQQAIFAGGFVPNSPEFRVRRDGVVYVAQRAEHLGSGEVRVYYVEEGDWDHVRYAVRPSGKPL